ncbi:hypothetical protein [Stenotrophomonas acidaminiphila]|uniref:hypothetical protein n=1 Tax=Stenotrophomonas acidaminiphila TaxID=128780 RepID=UPI0020C6B2CB|nr:hypothetical protein [Stenotrophomonas acidaminiphila]
MNAQTASCSTAAPAPADAGALAPSPHAWAGIDLPDDGCSATVVMKITHDTITVLGALSMGQYIAERQCWARTGRGSFKQTSGPEEFVDREDAIGLELAEFMDSISLPVAVANMLPGKRPSADAVAEAAMAVGA